MTDYDYDPEPPREVLDEVHAERWARARRWHWCPDCMGRTGRGSPCYEPPEENEEGEG